KSLFFSIKELDSETSVDELLRSWAANRDSQFRDRLAISWRNAGYDISVESMASRSKTELEIFIPIAACFAEYLNGYIIITEHGDFSLKIGLYAPQEFRDNAVP